LIKAFITRLTARQAVALPMSKRSQIDLKEKFISNTKKII